MKNLVILGTMLLAFNFANAQCKVYSGNYASYSKLVGIVVGGKVYSGNYASYSKLVGIIDGRKVYSGNYASYSKLVGIVDGKKSILETTHPIQN